MSPDIEKIFFERWPQFFTHKDDPMRSLMGFGFSCQDGWRTLLWKLFTDIEQALANERDSVKIRDFEITQVKQKLGILRVHAENTTPSVDALVDAAILRSRQMCECCGKLAILFLDGGRWATRCADCATQEGIEPPFDESGAPQVGSFCLVRGRLIISGVPLPDARQPERHLQLLRDQRINFHTQIRTPVRPDWKVFPRGRVSYDATTERFVIYADACILKNPELIAEIRNALNLPRSIEAIGDERYRCGRMLSQQVRTMRVMRREQIRDQIVQAQEQRTALTLNEHNDLDRRSSEERVLERELYLAEVKRVLEARLTHAEYLTCADFDTFDVRCCNICHESYPHYEMWDVAFSDGRHAWVCDPIHSVLTYATEKRSLTAEQEQMEALLTAICGPRDPMTESLESAIQAAQSDEERLQATLRYVHHVYGRMRSDEPFEVVFDRACGLLRSTVVIAAEPGKGIPPPPDSGDER